MISWTSLNRFRPYADARPVSSRHAIQPTGRLTSMKSPYCTIPGDEIPAPLRISDLIAATSNRRMNRLAEQQRAEPEEQRGGERERHHRPDAPPPGQRHQRERNPRGPRQAEHAQKTFVNGALFRVPLRIWPTAVNSAIADRAAGQI